MWLELSTMMCTTQCVIAKSFSRKCTHQTRTACKEDSHYSRSMQQSSKTRTYRSSYTCRCCRRTRTRCERQTTTVTSCTDQADSLTPPAASQPSVVEPRRTELTIVAFLRTSLSLAIQRVRSGAASNNRTRTCS